MIEEPPILTIRRNLPRPSEAQIAAFQNIPTGLIVDAQRGDGALDTAIKPLIGQGPERNIAGPALTADCGPADILASLAALRFLRTGDVLVSAFAGYQGCASAGDRLAGMVKNCGAAGLITDGPVRDSHGIIETGLPVWCTGLTPASPFTNGPGAVGGPVQIGGCRISTGDMIIADADGVVVVPLDRIDQVIDALAKVADLESALEAEIKDGLTIPPNIDALLESDATAYID